MKHGAMVGTLLIAFMASVPRNVTAQQRPSLSVQATVGLVHGHTAGEYLNDRQGLAVDLLVGVRAGAANSHGIVLGANASRQDGGPRNSMCYPATTRDGCIEPFPFFGVVGALVGWENASTTLRVMGGPAWAHAEADALAWQARIDASLPVIRRLGFVAALQGTVVPSYRGDAIRVFGLGLGVRAR